MSNINKGLGAAAVAADLFANFVWKINTNFSGKSNEEELKDDVKKGILKITSLIRNNVDMFSILSLRNDVATTEFIMYASFLIHNEFADRGYPKEPAFELIRMAIFDIFGKNTRYYLPIVKEICLDTDTHEEAVLNFMMRLYFTNKAGCTLPFDFIEQVDRNEIASHIRTYAIDKGLIDEADDFDLLTGLIKCMDNEGITEIIDDNVMNEAYKCVNDIFRK